MFSRFGAAEELMSTALAEHPEIEFRQRIVGTDLEHPTVAHAIEHPARLKHRLGALESERIENFVGRVDALHRLFRNGFLDGHSTSRPDPYRARRR